MPALRRFGFALLLAWFAFTVASPALRAQGAPPFSTNDPETPGPGKWEINLLATSERRLDERLLEGPTFDVNYGLGESLQLSYELSHLSSKTDGQPRLSGWSNSVAGVKWRFRDGGETGLSASVYPQIEFNTPGTSSRRRGLVESDTSVTLPFQVQGEWSGLTVVAEAGHVVHLHRRDDWFGGVACGRKVGSRLEFGAELYAHGSEHLARSDLLLNLGAHVEIDEHNGLVLAVGRELHNHFEARARFIGLIGWQFLR